MVEVFLNFINTLIYTPKEGMVHPGLPASWVAFVFLAMFFNWCAICFFLQEK